MFLLHFCLSLHQIFHLLTDMSNNALMAVSPIDGRYRRQVEDLSLYFSEYALIKYRVRVEIEYFIALCELPLEQLKGFAKEDFEKKQTKTAIKELQNKIVHLEQQIEFLKKIQFPDE